MRSPEPFPKCCGDGMGWNDHEGAAGTAPRSCAGCTLCVLSPSFPQTSWDSRSLQAGRRAVFPEQHRWNPCLSHSQAGLKGHMSIKSTDAKLKSSFEGLYWCNWEWKLFFHCGHNSGRRMLRASQRLEARITTPAVKCKGAEGTGSKFLSAQRAEESWILPPTLSAAPPCLCSPLLPHPVSRELCPHWWLLSTAVRPFVGGGQRQMQCEVHLRSTVPLTSQWLPGPPWRGLGELELEHSGSEVRAASPPVFLLVYGVLVSDRASCSSCNINCSVKIPQMG